MQIFVCTLLCTLTLSLCQEGLLSFESMSCDRVMPILLLTVHDGGTRLVRDRVMNLSSKPEMLPCVQWAGMDDSGNHPGRPTKANHTLLRFAFRGVGPVPRVMGS